MSKTIFDPDLNGKDLFDFLIKNKSLLIAEKKSVIKYADAFTMAPSLFVNSRGEITKNAPAVSDDATKLDTSLVINTCNWFDSHRDVHIPGLWKKSLSESKDFIHVQEHVMRFNSIISDEVKALTKKLSWKELGYDASGITEALIFNSVIDKERNSFMFDQYKKGYVKNHSVGMQYVRLELAINDEDYKEEFAVWGKYIDDIVNRDEVEEVGHFWAIKEAKVIEGSAVVRGSNRITPTLSVSSKSTGNPPPTGTDEQPQKFDLIDAIKKTTFIKN